MKAMLWSVVLVSLALGADAQQSTPAPSNDVHLTGCVLQGVEAGCVVMKDAQSGKLYQLLVRGPRPAPGIPIEITGTRFRGVTSCMQGLPILVARWSRSTGPQCPADEAPPR